MGHFIIFLQVLWGCHFLLVCLFLHDVTDAAQQRDCFHPCTIQCLPPATDSSLLMALMTWIKLFLNIFSLVCMCFPLCMCVVSLLKWHNLFLKCFSFLVQLRKTRLSYVLSLLIYLTNLNLYQFTLAHMLYKSFSWPLEHHVWGEDHMTGFACACNHHQQISSLVS